MVIYLEWTRIHAPFYIRQILQECPQHQYHFQKSREDAEMNPDDETTTITSGDDTNYLEDMASEYEKVNSIISSEISYLGHSLFHQIMDPWEQLLISLPY